MRFRSSHQRLSLMALYYSVDALRRLLKAPHERVPLKSLKTEATEFLTELMAFINRLGRTSNAPIRTAARDVASSLGLSALAKEISMASDEAGWSAGPPGPKRRVAMDRARRKVVRLQPVASPTMGGRSSTAGGRKGEKNA